MPSTSSLVAARPALAAFGLVVLGLATLGLPAAGAAQAAAAPRPASAPPPPLSLERVAAGLKPLALTYRASVRVADTTESAGTRSVRLVRTSEAGAPAWLLLDQQATGALAGVDSLVIGARDLAPARRVTRVTLPEGTAVLTMRFTADSVTGRMEMGGQAQSIAMRNVAGTAASDGVLLLVLAGAPLSASYAGSLRVLDPQAGGVRPLTMRVTGRERVTVPAGTFETWVVQVRVGDAAAPIGEATYYVADGGPVVRVRATSAQMGGSTLESVLESGAAPR